MLINAVRFYDASVPFWDKRIVYDSVTNILLRRRMQQVRANKKSSNYTRVIRDLLCA